MERFSYWRAWSSHQVFLRTLLESAGPEDSRALLARVRDAQLQEQWSRRALGLVVLATLAGVLVWWRVSAHAEEAGTLALMAAEVLESALVLATVGLCILSGCWLWNRKVLNRLQDEVARFVVALLNSRPPSTDRV